VRSCRVGTRPSADLACSASISVLACRARGMRHVDRNRHHVLTSSCIVVVMCWGSHLPVTTASVSGHSAKISSRTTTAMITIAEDHGLFDIAAEEIRWLGRRPSPPTGIRPERTNTNGCPPGCACSGLRRHRGIDDSYCEACPTIQCRQLPNTVRIVAFSASSARVQRPQACQSMTERIACSMRCRNVTGFMASSSQHCRP
jgi:hypothetical protein